MIRQRWSLGSRDEKGAERGGHVTTGRLKEGGIIGEVIGGTHGGPRQEAAAWTERATRGTARASVGYPWPGNGMGVIFQVLGEEGLSLPPSREGSSAPPPVKITYSFPNEERIPVTGT